MIEQLVVHPAHAPLRGSVPLPADEGVFLARLALASISRGTSRFARSEEGRSVAVFLEALGHFGVQSDKDEEGRAVRGAGLDGFSQPTAPLDLRGEAHVAALVLGLSAGRPFESELWVDEVLGETLLPVFASAGLARVSPLDRGLRVEVSRRTERAEGLEVSTTGVFPWVKQALLLLGLRASGPVLVDEALASPDHLERALHRARVPIETAGTQCVVHPPRDFDALSPQIWEIPGSPELAAHLGAASFLVPGSEIGARAVGSNSTRSAFFTLVRLLGAGAVVAPRVDWQGEPVSDLLFSGACGRGAELSGELMIRLGDGVLPLLAALARSPGTTVLRDVVSPGRAADGRVLGPAVGFLRSAGLEVELAADGIVLHGRGQSPLRALRVTTGGDARLALLGSLLGLAGDGPSVIDDVGCLREVFPRWVGTLRALGARVEVRTT